MSPLQSCGATLAVTTILTAIAVARASRAGDDLHLVPVLVLALSAGAVALHADSLGLAAVVAIGCVATCAATDVSSGFVYDVVIYVSGVLLTVACIADGTLAGTCFGAATAVAVAGSLHLLTGGRGLGLGDVKLFAIACAGLWSVSLLVLGGAFLLGAAISLAALAMRRITLNQRIPFAPYIALASIGAAAFHWTR